MCSGDGDGMKTICTRCKMVPPAPGKTKCLNCLDYEAVAQMKYWYSLPEEKREEQTKKRKENMKKRREQLKANGICTQCGKAKADEGYVTCERCRVIYRERQRANREYHRRQNGKRL